MEDTVDVADDVTVDDCDVVTVLEPVEVCVVMEHQSNMLLPLLSITSFKTFTKSVQFPSSFAFTSMLFSEHVKSNSRPGNFVISRTACFRAFAALVQAGWLAPPNNQAPPCLLQAIGSAMYLSDHLEHSDNILFNLSFCSWH